MAHSLFDFVKGIDFTALVTAAAGDHNTLIDSATPYADKGLILWSVDTAAGVPDVPNANTTPKWKRYIWLRIPHTSVVPPANTVPYFYAWNDTATSVATYLQWQRIEADFTTVNAKIAALQAELDASQLDITAATNTANAANSTAGTAATDATNALANAAIVAGNLATLNAQVNHTTSGLAPTRAVADSALSIATAAVTPAQLAAVNATIVVINSDTAITTSPEYAIVAGTILSIVHGLGVVPKRVQWVLVCKIADLDFVQDEEVPVEAFHHNGGNPYLQYSQSASVTTLRLRQSVFAPASTAGNLTVGSWRIKCYYAKS